MKGLQSIEKRDVQISEGIHISPFPVPKYKLLKSEWRVSPEGKIVMYKYSGNDLRVAFVHFKNGGAVHICYGNDKEFLYLKFTLKGYSKLILDTQKSNQSPGHYHLLKCKHCVEIVEGQKEFESISLSIGLEWIHQYQKEIKCSPKFSSFLCETLINKLVRPISFSTKVRDVVGHLQQILTSNIFEEAYLALKIKEILFLLCTENCDSLKSTGTKREIRLLEMFIDYIKENFLLNLNLCTVYEELGCSATAINRIVKSHLGIRPKELLTQTRMAYAKEQLVNGAMNVSELSYSLHYSAPNHFSRAFKRWFGYSPREIINIK